MKASLWVSLMCIVSIFILVSGCTNNTDNNSNNQNWLENYTPVHSIGSDTNDFWIEFPTGSDYYGQTIQYYNWVTDYVDDDPVLFVVHRTGCLGCKEQGDLVISLAEKYSDQVKFHDIDAVSSASAEIQQMANEAYLYDPNGAPGYIALTGIFTYVKDNGEIKIGWHSWELDVEDSVMESWIKDAIYYYNMNS